MATRKKPPSDEQLLRELPDGFLLCRTVGHAWRRLAPDRVPQFGVLMAWECPRCQTIRDDIVDRSHGKLLSRSYRYSVGYRLPGKQQGHSPISRAQFRVALLGRDRVE